MANYLIGDFMLALDLGEIPIEAGGKLNYFQYNGSWSGETIQFQGKIEEINIDANEQVACDNGLYELYRKDQENYLVYHWGSLFHGFTIRPEHFSCIFNPQMLQQPKIKTDWFFSVMSFHRQLLQRSANVLHASYIDVNGMAVLFTGPSNIGKSTQADMWEKYEGAQIINGDRVLLRSRNEKLYAYGYPCCGTSGICVNKTLPVSAIVVLEQGNENVVKEMTKREKISALVSATELYPWDLKEIDWAFAIADNIIQQVPVIKLECKAEKQAVEVLKQYLEEKMYGNHI